MKNALPVLAAALLCLASPGLAAAPEPSLAARQLFEQTLTQFHLPSADAQGAERKNLLRRASLGYEQVLKFFPTIQPWAAQAMRSLANVRAEQGNVEEAIQLYADLEKKYPADEWEILQSWKSAADLLWEHQRTAEARTFYKKLVARFDRPDASPVTRVIVRGSRARLAS